MHSLSLAFVASLTWVEIALLIFMSVFVGVLIWVFSVRRGAFNRAANIPLDDEHVLTPRVHDALEGRN